MTDGVWVVATNPLNQVSNSASAKGLGGAKAGSTIQSCSYASGTKPPVKGKQPPKKPLEYCDIKQLTLVLSAEGKSQTIVVDHDRKSEPVNPAQVAAAHVGALGSHDLVVEALADIEDRTGDGTVTKGTNPLGAKLTAVNKVSHSSFAPAHPHTELEVYNRPSAINQGGGTVDGRYFAPSGSGTSRTTWGFLWPFDASRECRYTCEGVSCGTLPIPQRTNTRLAIDLVVLPYEEWTIEIGLSGTRGGGAETGRQFAGNQDGDSSRKVTRTTVSKSRVGSTETSTKTEIMETPTGQARNRTTSTETTLDYTLLSADSQATSNIKESWNKRERTEKDDDKDYRKVTITRKIAGQEVQTDVSGTIKNIVAIKEVMDDLSKLFSSVKIGWSISYSYEILSGNIKFGWGHRWPAAYKEENRVYYVERFVKAGGTCELVNGAVTGFFGFAVDPWWAPVAIEIGAFLSVKAKVGATANIDVKYTNAAMAPSGLSGTLTFDPSLGFEAGAKANGRAFGYSAESKLVLETEFTFAMEGGLSTTQPPWLKANFRLGKENKKDDSKTDGLRLVGEVVFTGSSVRRYEIDPIVLVEGKSIWKDKYFWGDPAEKKT